MHYLARKLIRRKPKYMPWWMWKGFLLECSHQKQKKNAKYENP